MTPINQQSISAHAINPHICVLSHRASGNLTHTGVDWPEDSLVSRRRVTLPICGLVPWVAAFWLLLTLL
jgi:hypothetical protein